MTPSPAQPAAAPFDLESIRTQFPALSRTGPDSRPIVHADAPGGTQVHASVLDAMTEYMRNSNANSYGVFAASKETDVMVADVRAKAAAFTGGDPDGIVFGPNMTTLTWHLSPCPRRAARHRRRDRVHTARP